MTHTLRLTVALVFVLSAAALVSAQTSLLQENKTLFMNEQQSFIPGYPVGDIAIGDPKIADFRVLPGRRELLLFSRGLGQTTLTVWDQNKVKRHEILLTVTTRQAQQTESELKELLKEFPTVRVATLAGSLVVTGTVKSLGDMSAIDKIAAAAKAKNLVRLEAALAAPGTPGASGAATAPGTTNMPTPSSTSPTGRPLAAPGAAAAPNVADGMQVDYDIELLEASTAFRSGSYARGIEPSGRSLYKSTVRAMFGTEGEIFIGGNAVAPAKDNRQFEKQQTTKPAGGQPAQTVETGIRLKLRPDALAQNGQFTTFILVETNLPINSDTYDPDTWRRARWEFRSVSGEPFGVTGGDLLATPALPNSGSALGTASKTASRATSVPGVSGISGAQYVPVFGSLFGSKSYQSKTTQLLVILRPRFVVPRR